MLQHCSLDLETFHSRFVLLILVIVCISPRANMHEAQCVLDDHPVCGLTSTPKLLSLATLTKIISSTSFTNIDSILYVRREETFLDQCYTTVNNAYHAVPYAALGDPDHIMVHLIPSYRQKLKLF